MWVKHRIHSYEAHSASSKPRQQALLLVKRTCCHIFAIMRNLVMSLIHFYINVQIICQKTELQLMRTYCTSYMSNSTHKHLLCRSALSHQSKTGVGGAVGWQLSFSAMTENWSQSRFCIQGQMLCKTWGNLCRLPLEDTPVQGLISYKLGQQIALWCFLPNGSLSDGLNTKRDVTSPTLFSFMLFRFA